MDNSYFLELQGIIMEYNRFKPKNFIERWEKKHLLKKIKRLANRVEGLPLSVRNISDFVMMYQATIESISLDNVFIEEDQFSHETILLVELREDRKVSIGYKGAYDPNYLAVSIGAGTTEYNKLGRMEFRGGLITPDEFEDKTKQRGIEIVSDLLHGLFSIYLDMYLF